MNILIISSYLPYPLFSGGHIRLYNLIKQLSINHKITLVSEKRSYQTEKDIEELKKFCEKVIVVNRRKQWSLGNILKTCFSSYPFLMIGHRNNLMEEKIKEVILKDKFDLVHVETFYVIHNLPKDHKIPLILAEHNIEYLVYKRFARKSNLLLKFFFLLDVLKIRYWEEKYWKKADKLIAVSQEEKKIMKREDVVVVPNGVDLENFKFQISNFKFQIKEKKILFIGDFKWIQNRNSVEWILKEIWPKIISKIKNQKSKMNLKLWIVGRKIPDSIKKLADDKDVIFDENAPRETSKIYENADLLLAPIRVGGGTSYKILEAMASGVPVVTTTLGIEGIEARDNEHVLIEDKADNIANKVLELLENDNLYAKIAKNARKLIEEKYDWRIIAKKLENVYESVISK